jgi:alpha-tubulin suppressor-like RCC1 family protein
VPRGLRTLGLPNIDDAHLPGLLSAVLGFGADAQGQLGLHSATGLKTHVMPIDELRSKDFVQVVCGGCCTFFVSDSGKVLGSGSNRSLEIGFRMEIAQVETPLIIKPLRSHKVVQLATSPSSLGQAHTLALTSGGDVYAFGTSNCGALGLEHFTQSFPEPIRMTHTVPMIQIACGGRHSVFLAETGEVYATGDNRYGQLGIPDMIGTGTVTKVPVPSMRMVACGENHSLGVLSAGGVYAWGANAAGQCGLEHVVDVKQPAKVRFPMLPKQTAPFDLVSIAGGSQHTLVAVMVGSASFVLGCGSNVDGQLGLGLPLENGDTHFLAPFPIAGFAGDPSRVIVQVACAGTHSLALARTGETYAFGSNRFGQLGYLPPGGRERASSKVKLTKHDGVSNLWEPTRIDPLRVHHVRYISTSDRHSMVIAA